MYAWIAATLLFVSILSWKGWGARRSPAGTSLRTSAASRATSSIDPETSTDKASEHPSATSRRAVPREDRQEEAGEEPSEELAVTYDVAQRVISTLASLMRSGAHHRYAWEALTSALAVETQATAGPASTRAHTRELEAWHHAASMTASRIALGAPLTLTGLKRTNPDEHELPAMLRHVYWAQQLAEATGIAHAELLEALASHAQARAAAIRSQVTGIAAAQTTRRILALLPLGGLLMAQLLGADSVGTLFITTAGHVCLFAGCLLWAASLIWSRHLIRKMSYNTTEAGS